MRLFNEIRLDNSNKVKYYIGKVESVDKDYIVTFSIPDILENLSKYPTAYPKDTAHVKEIKIGDSILIEQLDSSTQFFSYNPLNKNNETGLYFGKVKIDITDGNNINIVTDSVKINLNSDDGTIFIGNGDYSLNQWIKDLGKALSQLHTEGGEYQQFGRSWYTTSLSGNFNKIQRIFK